MSSLLNLHVSPIVGGDLFFYSNDLPMKCEMLQLQLESKPPCISVVTNMQTFYDEVVTQKRRPHISVLNWVILKPSPGYQIEIWHQAVLLSIQLFFLTLYHSVHTQLAHFFFQPYAHDSFPLISHLLFPFTRILRITFPRFFSEYMTKTKCSL